MLTGKCAHDRALGGGDHRVPGHGGRGHGVLERAAGPRQPRQYLFKHKKNSFVELERFDSLLRLSSSLGLEFHK